MNTDVITKALSPHLGSVFTQDILDRIITLVTEGGEYIVMDIERKNDGSMRYLRNHPNYAELIDLKFKQIEVVSATWHVNGEPYTLAGEELAKIIGREHRSPSSVTFHTGKVEEQLTGCGLFFTILPESLTSAFDSSVSFNQPETITLRISGFKKGN